MLLTRFKKEQVTEELKKNNVPEDMITDIAQTYDKIEQYEVEKNQHYIVTMTKKLYMEFLEYMDKNHPHES